MSLQKNVLLFGASVLLVAFSGYRLYIDDKKWKQRYVIEHLQDAQRKSMQRERLEEYNSSSKPHKII